MHKYMDDTTLTTPVQKGSSGSMQSYVNQAVSWSTTNKMIPNVDKTKDMVISFHKQPIVIPPIMNLKENIHLHPNPHMNIYRYQDDCTLNEFYFL